jgi:hypothetical protein
MQDAGSAPAQVGLAIRRPGTLNSYPTRFRAIGCTVSYPVPTALAVAECRRLRQHLDDLCPLGRAHPGYARDG